MGDIGYISYSKSCLPVASIDECTAVSRICWVVARPQLDCHIMDVNPATSGVFPSNFIFPDFDYRMS